MLRQAARLAKRSVATQPSVPASIRCAAVESVCSTSGRPSEVGPSVYSTRYLGLRWHTGSAPAPGTECIDVIFHDQKDGSVKTVQVPLGQSLLEAAHNNDIDLEGACEGSLACSTCHVVVEDQEKFDILPEADDDENDMLDLAFALTDTSRLGCQIIAAKELDGLKVRIPSATRNFAVDGYVPKPH
ncbi:hypothetical protein WJX77_002050 [Trebouxia sp. C0004]